MSLTEGEREKLKALCDKFGLDPSIINSKLSYQHNLAIMVKAIANKFVALHREAKAYKKEFSRLLRQEFGKVIVSKCFVSIGDRIKEISKAVESVLSKIETISEQVNKEDEEIQKLPETSPADKEIKWVKMEAYKKTLEIEKAYIEYAEHLLDEVEWLVKILKEVEE